MIVIIGLGTDIVEIKRIRELSQNPRFSDKIYTEEELKYALACGHYHCALAARFAAKEAAVKALGHGFGGWPLQWVEVANRAMGAPYLILHGDAKTFAEGLGMTQMHLSLSHSADYAIAVVIAEK